MAEQNDNDRRLRERVLSILNHDLRTPLSTMLTGISVLASRATPQDRRVLDRMERSARRMDKMIGDVALLARSRLGGGIPIHAKRMDLGEACAHVIEEVEQEHPETPIAFERNGDLRGEWDPARIEQVLATVVTNVVERSRHPVVVRASEDGERVHVEIDSMEPVREDAFDPFSNRSTELGLFLARELTQAHGGQLGVKARDDCTVLAIDLPRHAA